MASDLQARIAALAAGQGLTEFVPDTAFPLLARLVSALESTPAPPTRLVTTKDILEGHIADSLSALGISGVRDAAVIGDIGSGAGFPGLALAAALPAARVDLIEATARKCEVITKLAEQAGIGNAFAIAERVETWAGGAGRGAYDVASARAVAMLPVLVEYAAPLLKPDGIFVAWKGGQDEAEAEAGRKAAELVGLTATDVLAVTPFPGSHSRHLHVFRKTSETPERFPRRPGIPSKRPLA
ncbi:MAG: rRNA (guanine527-N7)-methyltransferase [Thermoleophilaceae bacterium]|nr:rRNA (guanine527-N7)-methyltransferase [Thermoleophilaceae bacterium]